MKKVKLRNIIQYLKDYPTVETLLFIGGNSKNGPEYFFRKHIKKYGIKLDLVSNKVPRIHQFHIIERTIQTVSLTSSSGSANRAIGSMPLYQELKKRNTNFNTFDFRIQQYENYI